MRDLGSVKILQSLRDSLEKLAEHRIFRILLVTVIFAVGIGVRLAKAYFAKPADLGDFSDLETLHQGAVMGLEGKDIYAITVQTWSVHHFFAYPAGIYWLSVLILRASIAGDISYLHAAQLVGFAFDTCIAVLVFLILRTEYFYKRVMALLLTLFNPFMFSNTLANVKPDDALMLTSLLAAFFLLGLNRFRSASFIFGFSLTTKQFPILLLPYFLYHLARRGQKKCIVVIVGAFILFSMPFIAYDPLTYLDASYLIHASRASAGDFGANAFSGLNMLWQNPVIRTLGLIMLLAIFAFIYVQFIESDPYTFAFILAFSFVSFYWVLFVQYFSWFVPFLVISITARIQPGLPGPT